MKKNVGILLGAGSSAAAGFPSTRDLTELVLSGRGFSRSSNGCYYIEKGGDEPPTSVVKLVNCMVKRLYASAQAYFSTYAGRRANYEDIYYLARQAFDDEFGEMENPAIRSFLDELHAEMSPLIKAAEKSKPSEPYIFDNLGDSLSETCNYISDVVSQSLLSHKPAPESRQLNVIEQVCKDFNVTCISTLCHDVNVETYLRRKGIAFADGFSESKDVVTQWNGNFIPGMSTPFLKLHGSVDWFRYPDDKIRRIPKAQDPQRIQIGGRYFYAEDGRPLLLIGTFNKISEYSSGIFRELHHRFRSTIVKASTMVVCGYGFGDKGINSELIDWCSPGRRFVIIHPDPDSLIANARGAIRKNWCEWIRNESISIVEKKFEDVEMTEFTEAMAR